MHQFFIDENDIEKGSISIKGSDATHICTVLRLHSGDVIKVFDGQGLSYLVRLEDVKNKLVKGEVILSEKIDTESSLKIHLGQSLIKGKSFDGRGNYAMGVKEHIIFPEIEYDKVDQIRGLDIVICTTAKTDEEAKELLRGFDLPFQS